MANSGIWWKAKFQANKHAIVAYDTTISHNRPPFKNSQWRRGQKTPRYSVIVGLQWLFNNIDKSNMNLVLFLSPRVKQTFHTNKSI